MLYFYVLVMFLFGCFTWYIISQDLVNVSVFIHSYPIHVLHVPFDQVVKVPSEADIQTATTRVVTKINGHRDKRSSNFHISQTK